MRAWGKLWVPERTETLGWMARGFKGAGPSAPQIRRTWNPSGLQGRAGRPRLFRAACVGRPVRVGSRVPGGVPASPVLNLDFGPRTFGLPDGCVVSTLCTQTQRGRRPRVRLPVHRTICSINGYFIYIVRIVPPGLFTPKSGRPGRSVWTGDYTNGWRAWELGEGNGRGCGWKLGSRRPRGVGQASRGTGHSWCDP